MIKAILLIFDPIATWEGIVLDRKTFRQVLFFYLTPLILISVAGQAAGLVYLGQHPDDPSMAKIHYARIFSYIISRIVLDFVVVFVCAKMVKTIAETFHNRNNFAQCLTVMAYSLSPLFVVQLLNVVPGISLWVGYGIGIAICLGTLYHGLPRVLLPDPPHAFGLYLMSALLMLGVSGLAEFLAMLVLAGRIKLLHSF